ncbi:hypothetical protein TRFO_40269 [Tritrichomonas foetus]|uniref:Uncharacterized protein n=1 Tax=Tritrichomonas foetus TaxID=1144522 RepID=A0A1J4J1R4_9EUKA|nr:hypothetical protein TRFO_40269 [Tritrichomonas foetus]|eukprot:OHS93462.1 hypothetical protein TRFO_40269 [Tritrichomonas foetus]
MSFDDLDNLQNTQTNLDSDFEPAIPDPDEHQITQIQTAYKSFKDPLPDLESLAEDNKSLQYIAKGLQALFAQPGYVKYNDFSRREIDIAVRTLIFQLCKISREKGRQEIQDAMNDKGSDANMVVKLREQLTSTEKVLGDMEKRLKESDETIEELQRQNNGLVEENKGFFQEQTELMKKMNALRAENDTNVAELKSQCDQYEDKIRELNDKLKLNEITSKRITDQLERSNEETASLNAELLFMKNKISSKSEKLEITREKLEDLTLENRRLDSENQTLSATINELNQRLKENDITLSALNQETLNQLDEENQKLRESITHLSTVCSTQSEDLAAVQLLHSQSTDLLRQQLELIAQYDAELNLLNNEKEDLQTQSEGDAKLISALQEQVARAREEAANVQVVETSHELDEIRLLLRPRFGDSDPVQTIRELVEGATNEELQQQNARQAGLIENILRFISRIVNTGELKDLLPHDSPERKLADDEAFRDQLLIEIARCRQLASQHSNIDLTKPSPESVQNVINTLVESEKPEFRELYDILVSQTVAADTIRKLYEKANTSYESALNDLKKGAEIVNYDGPVSDLPSIISEKLLAFRAFTQKLANVVDDDYDPNDFDSVLKFLFRYVSDSASVLHVINSDLRQVIEYEGELPELPTVACDYITSLQNQLQEIKEQCGEINNYDEKFHEFNGHFHNELTKASKQINELESQVSTKDVQMQTMSQDLEKLKEDYQLVVKDRDDARQHANDLEVKYSKFYENYEDLEQDAEKLRKENASLRDLMEKKNRNFDDRLNRLIKEEREQHADDLKRAEERQKKREDKFHEEIKAKATKITQLKKKMRDIIDQYEKAFKKQKEATAAIRQQNEIYAAKLDKVTGPVVSVKEVERLRTEIKALEAEKMMLNTKLKQTTDMVEKVQAIRDNYWMAQIAMKEAEVKETVSETASQLNDHYDQFMDQLVGVLEPYMPNQFDMNEDAILNAITSLIERMEAAENDSFDRQELSREQIIQPALNADANREAELAQQKTLAALQEWDRWGRDLFVNVTDGQVPSQSCKDLRYTLGEMILASIGHRKLVYRLESLRSQKQLLMRMSNVPQRKDTYPSFRMLLIVAIGSMRILRKTGHFPSNYVQQVMTPSKQTTVSLF